MFVRVIFDDGSDPLIKRVKDEKEVKTLHKKLSEKYFLDLIAVTKKQKALFFKAKKKGDHYEE